MVSQQAILCRIRAFMAAVDDMVRAYATDAIISLNDGLQQRCDTYNGTMGALHQLWMQIDASCSGAPHPTRAAAAATWVLACIDADLPSWLRNHFDSIPAKAATAADPTARRGTRRNAVSTLTNTATGAFILLDRLLNTLPDWLAYGNPEQKAQAAAHFGSVLSRDFMRSAAAAAQTWSSHAAWLSLPTSQAALEAGGGYDASGAQLPAMWLWSSAAVWCAKHARLAASTLMWHLISANTSAGGAAVAALPPAASRLLQALSASQLVSVAAGVITSCPAVCDEGLPPDMLPEVGAVPRGRSATDVHHATKDFAQALYTLYTLRLALMTRSGAGGGLDAPDVAALSTMLGHRDVCMLRGLMLERLLCHGVVPDVVDDTRGGGGGGEGGRMSTWWLPALEASRGRVAVRRNGTLNWTEAAGSGGGASSGGGDGGDTAGWLEDEHCHLAFVSLGFWRWVGRGLLSDGVRCRLPAPPGAPSPLRMAQLAARTAEAMCRLCRGQGLQGAYGPAPEWQFVRTPGLMGLFAFNEEAAALPAAQARECVRHWLEAAAWALALGVEAVEAELSRRGGTKPNDQLRSVLAKNAQPANQVEGLMPALRDLCALATDNRCGLQHLDAATRQDISRRLQRAGLGASVDAALRLAFTAADRASSATPSNSSNSSAIVAAAKALHNVPTLLVLALRTQLMPIHRSLSACGATDASPAAPGAQGAGGQTPCGGSGGGGDAAGVMITLGKRARALAGRLGELAAVKTPAARRQEGALLEPAERVLWGLMSGLVVMERQMRQRAEGGVTGAAAVAASRAGAGTGLGAVGGGADGASDAGLLGEMWSFLLQAACALTTQLAVAVLRQAAASGTPPSANLSSTPSLSPDVVAHTAECLRALVAACRWRGGEAPGSARLLACQPHGLLAAAAGLLGATAAPAAAAAGTNTSRTLSVDDEKCTTLAMALTEALLVLAADEELSGRVKTWLAPPEAEGCATVAAPKEATLGGDTAAAAGGGCGQSAERGCLEQPLRAAAVPVLVSRAPPFTGYVLALLKLARGSEGGSSNSWGGNGGSDEDGGFRHTAMGIAALVFDTSSAEDMVMSHDPMLPDGSTASSLFIQQLTGRTTRGSQEAAVAAVAESLPTPVRVAPAAVALRKLRVCGNPRCGSFERACEGALDLKQCGGCRAVRYCCPGCQRASWPEHKRVCAELKAVAAGGKE